MPKALAELLLPACLTAALTHSGVVQASFSGMVMICYARVVIYNFPLNTVYYIYPGLYCPCFVVMH